MYTFQSDKDRFHLHESDEIINNFHFWCITGKSDDDTDTIQWHRKYLLSDSLLESLNIHILQRKSNLQEWCRGVISNYVIKMKNIIQTESHLYAYLSKSIESMSTELEKWFNIQYIREIVNQLSLGYLRHGNQKFDEEIYKTTWIGEFYVDASHRTQKHIVNTDLGGGGRKIYIKATESRVIIPQSFMLDDTYLLERGAERHKVIFGDQLSTCVAKNMYLIQTNPERFYVHAQNDRATQNNVFNVRNIIIEGIRQKLTLFDSNTKIAYNPHQVEYINPHGIIFRFDEFAFLLSQEINHVQHRIQQLGGFKLTHVDGPHFKVDIQFIIKNIRLQYDAIQSPVVLYTDGFKGPVKTHEKYYTPYDAIKKSQILNNPEYDWVISRMVRSIWMLKGTKVQKNRRELEKFQSKCNTKGLGGKVIRREFNTVINHLPPYLIPRFFSV